MNGLSARFVGVELYFDDLERARKFYIDILGLRISDEEPGHHARFDSGAGFICLEGKGCETYPSRDKAVLFFEVSDLRAAVATIGRDRLLREEEHWAVLQDPEGHSILLLEKGQG
jgi:catechol 2,3-dioxygenase-like lactoylglutathione lyase family enzyme